MKRLNGTLVSVIVAAAVSLGMAGCNGMTDHPPKDQPSEDGAKDHPEHPEKDGVKDHPEHPEKAGESEHPEHPE